MRTRKSPRLPVVGYREHNRLLNRLYGTTPGAKHKYLSLSDGGSKAVTLDAPDGPEIHIALNDNYVVFTDPRGAVFKFKADLLPEVLGSLSELERVFWNSKP